MSTVGQIILACVSVAILGGCLYLCYIAILIHDEEKGRKRD
jgi:hypothetical protein